MFNDKKYLRANHRLIADVERGVNEAITAHPMRFSCVVHGASKVAMAETVVLGYDTECYSEEEARFMAATARLRGHKLYALLSMVNAINKPDEETEPIDELNDESATMLLPSGLIDLSKTTLLSGRDEATMYELVHATSGADHRLYIAKIGTDHVLVKDNMTFGEDPELFRVLSFLLPDISDDDHATLIKLLGGRIEDVEGTATSLLRRYIGTSREEEATRALDMIVDRSLAVRSVHAMKLIDVDTPTSSRLIEWAGLFA